METYFQPNYQSSVKIKYRFFLKRYKSLKFTSYATFLKKQPDNIFQPNEGLNMPGQEAEREPVGKERRWGGGAGDSLFEKSTEVTE